MRIRAGDRGEQKSVAKTHSPDLKGGFFTVSVRLLTLNGEVVIFPHAAGCRVMIQETLLDTQDTPVNLLGVQGPRRR